MQDIPRNELLNKLAAGWKCRRKSWSDGDLFGTEICRSVSAKQLLADDWEGEPPGPMRKHEGCAITFAFEHLQKGAAFIRRGFGEDEIEVNCHHTNIALTTNDILANDWEVWG